MNSVSASALRGQLWSRKLRTNVAKRIFFKKFINVNKDYKASEDRAETSPDAVVQVITDFGKGYKAGVGGGNVINFGMPRKLTSTDATGVSGDSELEGNEVQMTVDAESLTIDQIRNAVRLTGDMDEMKAAYNMRESAQELLATWMAEFMQLDMFNKICGKTSATFANTPDAPAATRHAFAGGQSAENGLTSSHKFDAKCIIKMQQMAKTGTVKIQPIMIEGRKLYMVIVHPYQMADLWTDPVWCEAQKNAWYQGMENPIFEGAGGVLHQCIVYEHEDIYNYAGGSGSVNIARAVLLGAQALVKGEGRPVKWVEKKFDYDNIIGFSCGAIFGNVKPMFNSVDAGVITCSSYADAFATS